MLAPDFIYEQVQQKLKIGLSREKHPGYANCHINMEPGKWSDMFNLPIGKFGLSCLILMNLFFIINQNFITHATTLVCCVCSSTKFSLCAFVLAHIGMMFWKIICTFVYIPQC